MREHVWKLNLFRYAMFKFLGGAKIPLASTSIER